MPPPRLKKILQTLGTGLELIPPIDFHLRFRISLRINISVAANNCEKKISTYFHSNPKCFTAIK